MWRKGFETSSFLSQNISNPRKFGLWDKQSSNTYQKSIISYTIPKEERFKSYSSRSENFNFYDYKKQSNRGASFGVGDRSIFNLKDKAQMPSPNAYNLKSNISSIATSIKHRHEDANLLNKQKYPGPGAYNISPSKNTNFPVSLKFRHGFYYDEEIKYKKFQISPQTYNPSLKYTQQSRFSNLKFSNLKREEMVNRVNKAFPGPGSYNLPSVFDKTKKYRPSIN